MKGRDSFGYVVGVEGSRVSLNVKDTHKGQYASHRDGISSVVEMNGLFGVDAGARILVLRVNSLSFAEPREVHKSLGAKPSNDAEPLRQIIGTVAGWIIRESESRLRFVSDSLTCPVLGAEAFPLSREEMYAVIKPICDNGSPVRLGRESRGSGDIEISITDLLGRHMAVLGSTGQGKSCFTAAIIQQLVKLPNPRIVVFDINGEYQAAMKGHVSKSECKITKLGGKNPNFKIPYYAFGRNGLFRMLLPSDKTQRPALAFALDHLHQVSWHDADKGASLVSQSNAVLFQDCRNGNAQDAWNALEALRTNDVNTAMEWPNMMALACLTAESHSVQPGKNGFERSSFHYSNVAPLITRIHRLIDDPLFRQVVDIDGGDPAEAGVLDWRKEGTKIVEGIFGGAHSSWKIHIVDLRSVAHDLSPLILGSLLELFALNYLNAVRDKPIRLCSFWKKHNHYLRQAAGEDDILGHNLAYERLAKEGRKFGVGLWISTQRPVEVSSTVLAQCGTWVVFRLTSEQDLKTVAAAGEWVDRTELSRIAGLPRRQALVFGSSVAVPVRVYTPEASPCPDSHDPDFSQWEKNVSGSVPRDKDNSHRDKI